MIIHIITSCTGEKAISDDRQLTLDDFNQGAAHVKAREKELKDSLRSAGEMYTGEQHVRLMRGVAEVRKAGLECEVEILSAGYGFVPESRKIAPYECTFATMKAKELKTWAKELKVPEGFRRTLVEPYDLGLILLGDNYLKACEIGADLKLGGPTIMLTAKGPAKKLPEIPNLRVVTLSNADAKRFSCGLVGLKGEIAKRLLARLNKDPDWAKQVMDPGYDLLAELANPIAKAADSGDPSARGLARGSGKAVANSRVDVVINLPGSWRDKPHRTKMQYFIPEWDDLVDPDFDFESDGHSGGRGSWENEVYAHQMYPEPNYDGILMSRAVAEKSKSKDARLNQLGVHRYIRVPREFPVMGDCGAFDYIMDEVPPYSTEDVLDYYTRLDFDFGVSVDHLIVKATEQFKDFRYELTIANAEDFLKKHRAHKLRWTPIGAVQGWDPKSYAEAARRYAQMGYTYIALGGLVRYTTTEILKIVQAVHDSVPANVKIHLFGLARLDAMLQFSRLGVSSVDSASHLRQAWIGAKDNFWSLDGSVYAAIRIPQPGKSYRAKRMVSEGRAPLSRVSALEQACLAGVRKLDKGTASVNDILDLLDEYDQLITPERRPMREHYRRTLEAMPWKNCPCEICQKSGVEVIIFRGNNRNRRRGFHNTYVFYRLMQRALNGEAVASLKSQKGQKDQMELFQT